MNNIENNKGIRPKYDLVFMIAHYFEKKIEEIINSEDVEHYKNLRYDMKDRKRVQLGHFVLVFKFLKEADTISFVDFGHHDEVYERAPN